MGDRCEKKECMPREIAKISRLSYVFFCLVSFCYQAPTNLGGDSVNLVNSYLIREIEDSV